MLTGKNLLLTGANRGIGRAILELFAKNGANVWCLVRHVSESFAAQTKELSENCGVSIRLVQADLAEEEEVKRAFREINSERLPIDILINNAAENHKGSFLMTPISEMERLFRVNYFAPVQLMQLVSKNMIRHKGGVIINIGSVSGLEHNTGNLSYGSTKAALLWMTQTASRELAAYNIRVNAIAPGVTDTEINSGNEETIEKEVIPRMNIRGKGSPEEIAQCALFLASDASSFVSGQILRADGGRF